MRLIFLAFALIAGTLCTNAAYSDTFGSLSNTFDIEFVTIGNPGNVADTMGAPNPAGKVDYVYRIGKYEISEDMINKANAEGGLGITHSNRGANKPATWVTWFEAARFVNWLNTSSGRTAAYKFDGGGNLQPWNSNDAGYDANNQFRNGLAKYFLPSFDEWYKAAYYDPAGDVYYRYPTGSNVLPTAVVSGTLANTVVYRPSIRPITNVPADITLAGGLSPYGTMGQGGNATEWNEYIDKSISFSAVRGGSWLGGWPSSANWDLVSPTIENSIIGFRVASIPEPSSFLFGTIAGVGLLARRRR